MCRWFFSRHFSHLGLSANSSLKRSLFRWQCSVNSPTIHCSWFLFSLLCWQRVSVCVPLPTWVHLRNPVFPVISVQSLNVAQVLKIGSQILAWRTDLPFRSHRYSHDWHLYQVLCYVLSVVWGTGESHRQFWDDQLVARSFNHSLVLWENVDVTIPR
jgi:hypothetical protein